MTQRFVAFDTETWLISAGLLAPPLVCGSFYDASCAEGASIFLRGEALDEAERLLDDGETRLVGQNIAFDFGVCCHARPRLLPKVFAAYEDGRVRDTRVREKLILLARGELKTDEDGAKVGFSMADIVRRRFGVDLSEDKKNPDAWRLNYHKLDDVPLEEWPEEAKRYAMDDAVWTLRIFDHQAEECDGLEYLPNEREQTYAAWCLHLMGMWGVRVDGDAVYALDRHLRAHVEKAHDELRRLGILKGKTVKGQVEWSKDTKVIKDLVVSAFERDGRPVPQTAPSAKFPDGQVKTDAETLKAANDPALAVLASVAEDEKLLSTYVPALLQGIHAPICPGWNVLVESGRTSCMKPNLQNPPRKGGVRECFVPRAGYLYLATDYSTLELCAWAQVCLDLLGFSDMAEAIRAGKDLHSVMGLEILKAGGGYHDLDYDAFRTALKGGEGWAADARQLAKAKNFGLPGGLGAATFVAYAWATYNVRVSVEDASRLKQLWLRTWREAQPYFNLISAKGAYGESFAIEQIRSGRVRGGCTFTSAANSYFQGLAADGAKEALRRITRECYLDVGEPLYGCRPVAFLHDEFILEVPDDIDAAHAANVRLMKHMVEGMQVYIPDVPITAEPTLMRRWYKEAKPVYDEQGRLRVWEPKVK